MTKQTFKKQAGNGLMIEYMIIGSTETRYYTERVDGKYPTIGDISKKAYDMQKDAGEIQEAGDE